MVTTLATTVAMTSLMILPVSPAHPASLPNPGDSCMEDSFWKSIPVSSKHDNKTGEATLKKEARRNAKYQLTCVPSDAYDHEVRENSVKWRMGEWELQRQPERTKLVLGEPGAIFDPLAQNDPCRLERVDTSRPLHLGWRNPALEKGLSSTEPAQGLVFHITPSPNAPATPAMQEVDYALAEGLADANRYWQDQSNGRFRLETQTVAGYREIPPDTTPRSVATSLMESLPRTYDVQGLDTLIVMTDYIGPQRINGLLNHVDPPLTIRGAEIRTIIYLQASRPEPRHYEGLLKHEIGHAHGLVHLNGNDGNTFNARFVGRNTLMGKSSDYITGYERWILGWIPDKRVVCISGKQTGTLELRSVTARDYRDAMAIFRIDRHSAVVVEHVTKWPGDDRLFVYWVNVESSGNDNAGRPGVDAGAVMYTYRPDSDSMLFSEDFPDVSDHGTGAGYRDAIVAWMEQNPGSASLDADAFLSAQAGDFIGERWFGLRIPSAIEHAGRVNGTRNWESQSLLKFDFDFQPPLSVN